MKKYITLIIGLTTIFSRVATAQNQCSFCEDLKNNVVTITTSLSDGSDENGFGTIVSEVANKLYVVTAKHVVYKLDNRGFISSEAKPTSIKVKFFKDQGKVFTARPLNLKTNSLDITLIEIDKPQNFKWSKNFYSKAIQSGTKVWFIGRAGGWYVPTGASVGSINDVDSNDEIIIDITSIQPGTSGAPLLSSDGIVGLIYEDSPTGSRAYPIEKIIKVMTKDWNYEWQMTLNTNITQPAITEREDNAWVEIVNEKKEKNKMEKLEKYVSKNQGAHIDDARTQFEGLLFANINRPKYQELYVKHFPAGQHINEVENIVWKNSSGYVPEIRYELYMELFPNGKYYDRASKEREKLNAVVQTQEEDALFADIKKGQVFSVEKYFEKYPQGKYLDQIDDILWNKALDGETEIAFKEKGFEEYLQFFPKGKNHKTALEKVKKYKMR